MKKQRVNEAPTPPAPTPTSTTAYGLRSALCCGALEFLSGAAVLETLNVSRSLRLDTTVVGCALRRVTSGPRWRVRLTDPAPPVVRLAWHMQTLISKLQDSDPMSVYPVIGALSDGRSAHSAAEALPAVLPIRHRELADDYNQSTAFGAHWDQVGDHGCALCEAALAAVCKYREETEAFTDRFEASLAQREAQWEGEGLSEGEVFENAFEFQEQYFREEPFYSAYVASRSDAMVLDHICGHDKFAKAVRPKHALSLAMRESCRRVVQPIKRLLGAACTSRLTRSLITLEEKEEIHDVVYGTFGGRASGVVAGFLVSARTPD